MFKSQKHVFWQALVLTLIFFNLGVLLGYMMEAGRADEINELYLSSELELLNVKIQNDLLDIENLDCDFAIKENIRFADKIYEEALILLKYEEVSAVSEALIVQHKKYDLLRTLLWMNSIKLKKRCNANYHNIVYLYEYSNNNPPVEIGAKQKAFSRTLGEFKAKQGENIILIPIAADQDFSSINILMDIYNITELPTILIDEKIKLTELEEIKDLEQYLT